MFETAAQYYMGKDVSALPDEQWAGEIARLLRIREKESETND